MEIGNLRSKIISVLDIVLRVPPVFIVDSLFKNNSVPFGGSKLLDINLKARTYDGIIPPNRSESFLDKYFNAFVDDNEILDTEVPEPPSLEDSELSTNIIWVTSYLYCLLASLVIFSLSTRQLFSFYLWLLSVLVIFWSYYANNMYIDFVLSIKPSSLTYELFSFQEVALKKFITNYFLQVCFSLIFCFVTSTRSSLPPQRIIGAFFIVPTMLSLLPGLHPHDTDEAKPESGYMRTRNVLFLISPLISTGVVLFYTMINVLHDTRHIITRIKGDFDWARTIVRHYGIYTLVENQWNRLHVPQVLRVFWLTRVVEQALVILSNSAAQNIQTLNSPIEGGNSSLPPVSLFTVEFFSSIPSEIPAFKSEAFYEGVKELLVRGCETIIALLGMTSVISSISHEIGAAIQWFLSSEAPEDRGIGTVSAILFFILALQTGITGMEPEKRFQRLYRNVCLLFTAILHFIHNIVSPQLFSLSASRNMSIAKHARSLLVCLLLILFPAWFMVYLWRTNSVSTWLLAVSAFSIEVIIKVAISLLIYILFMVDAFRATIWEPLDDYVYYIKSVGSTIEFVFGIFLFFNGAWILLFESGGTIRALMMCIHAYFNIWLQAKQGWKKFMRRRNAVYKINSLPEATAQQLQDFDDVCAICYQDLRSARITRCKHFFHGVCLRKWLYVQDICPLCHEPLNTEADLATSPDGGAGVQNQAENVAQDAPAPEPSREETHEGPPDSFHTPTHSVAETQASRRASRKLTRVDPIDESGDEEISAQSASSTTASTVIPNHEHHE